jgi:hypothetical protein
MLGERRGKDVRSNSSLSIDASRGIHHVIALDFACLIFVFTVAMKVDTLEEQLYASFGIHHVTSL